MNPATNSSTRPSESDAGLNQSPPSSHLTFPPRSTTSQYRVTTSYGEACAGSLGVRGLLTSVASTQTETTPALITFALEALQADGVKRAHIFVGTEGELLEAALKAGFEPREGESLYQIELSERPISPNTNLYPYVLRDGTAEDLIRLGLRLADIPELAFESWELPLLFSNIDKHDRFFKVVDLKGEIVGISVGGSSGASGTISHTWVAREHRGHGLGNALSDASLVALYDGGARNIHLMTVAGNSKANIFWEHQGFLRATGIQFLEVDL